MNNFNDLAPWGRMARCIVNPDHTVAYYLDPNNSNLKLDGTPVNWQEVEDLVQNVMVEIPKSYTCKKKIGDKFYFGVSDKPVDTEYIKKEDWRIDPAFFRCRDKLCNDPTGVPVEVDYRYVGAFIGWTDASGRLRSLPNKTIYKNTTGVLNLLPTKMGNGWGGYDYFLYSLLRNLYITEYGVPDTSKTIGKMKSKDSAKGILVGTTLMKGNNTFGNKISDDEISYRGIEDFVSRHFYVLISNILCVLSSIFLSKNYCGDNTNHYIKKTRENYVAFNGNISNIEDDIDLMFFPKAINGTSYASGLMSRTQVIADASVKRFAQIDDSSNGVFSIINAGMIEYTGGYYHSRLCL